MKTLPIGTIGTTAKEIKTMAGTIKKGAVVQIIDVGSRGYDLVTETGFTVLETGFDSVIANEQLDYYIIETV